MPHLVNRVNWDSGVGLLASDLLLLFYGRGNYFVAKLCRGEVGFCIIKEALKYNKC